MVYTVKHPAVKLIFPKADMREKTLWAAYKLKVMSAWPGEMDEQDVQYQDAIKRLMKAMKI